MGESGGSVGVSVSFGKYENDAALCWEKWSTFPPNNNNNNKYLEEVGKCSTPGSVAQKKAFFEAHYKKIAAMKAAEADLLDQQKPPSDSEPEIPSIHGSENLDVLECLLLPSQSPITVLNTNGDQLELELELEKAVLVNGELVKQQQQQQHLLLPSQSPITSSNTNVDKLQEAAFVNNESMKLVKQHFQMDLEPQDPPEIIPKPKSQSVTPELNPNKVEKNSAGVKKKPASVIPKSTETPGSRLSKPKQKETSTSSLSLKKASAPSSSTKNKKPSVSESSRRVSPVSLQLSMSMNSINSDTPSSVTSSRRRSLFMEQMGDKDIVKRAFKTFQNRVNQLPSYDTAPKQLPTKRAEQKSSTSVAYQKENGRSRKEVEKINPARGPSWKSVSCGSLKEVGVNERRLKAGPTAVALKSNQTAERRKEFFKNLKEKSNAREAERSSKLKEVKDAEMKKVKQNLNFKAELAQATSDKETIDQKRKLKVKI